jgi:hypothetical protein
MEKVSKIYTTEELKNLTAGGDSYIRTKDGQVKGLAITKQKNPMAPKIITVSKGPRIIKNAELLANTKLPVPTYIKLGVNQWRYAGDYKVIRFSQNTIDIKEYHGKRPENEIYGILFMEKNKQNI